MENAAALPASAPGAWRRLLARCAGALGSAAILAGAGLPFALLSGCGGGDDDACFSDVGQATQVSASQSPYTLRSLSNDLGISAVRWTNATKAESGTGTVTHVQECVFFICGTWSELIAVVPLVKGANTVQVFSTTGRCESRTDYVVTLG
jgi:hypothetical protein